MLCWTVLGDGWDIKRVERILGNRVPRPSFSTRVAREVSKRKLGTVVYAQRGTKPHMALVKPHIDPAHIRPGALETLDWLIVDPRECSVRISRRVEPKLIEAVRVASTQADCYTTTELGKLIAQWVRDSLYAVPLRKGAGGVYLVSDAFLDRVDTLERMLSDGARRVVFFKAIAPLSSKANRETLLRALLLYSESVYESVVRYASTCAVSGTRSNTYTRRLQDECTHALRVVTHLTADVPHIDGEALSKVYSRINSAIRCVAQLKRTTKARRQGKPRRG